jgi:mono/diheme cytochrome c family protein
LTVPIVVRIGILVLGTTAFYGYVGQMVPQKEVQPPEEIALGTDMTTADLVKVGRDVFTGKGLCSTCHTLGKAGALRFPDLDGIGARAKTRIPGMSDVDYLAQSMYDPNTFIVPGFVAGMPTINQPPIGLTDQEILTLIAYLQSLGGTPTVTLQTTHRYLGAGGAPASEPAKPTDADPGKPQQLTIPKKDGAPGGTPR